MILLGVYDQATCLIPVTDFCRRKRETATVTAFILDYRREEEKHVACACEWPDVLPSLVQDDLSGTFECLTESFQRCHSVTFPASSGAFVIAQAQVVGGRAENTYFPDASRFDGKGPVVLEKRHDLASCLVSKLLMLLSTDH